MDKRKTNDIITFRQHKESPPRASFKLDPKQRTRKGISQARYWQGKGWLWWHLRTERSGISR